MNYNKKRKLNKLKASLLTLMMVLFAMPAMAQTVNMTNGTSEVGTGGVNFYDSGGAGSGGTTRYRHNEDYTYTFTLPSLQSESGLKVVFSMLRVNDDHLYIYEGTSMNDDNLIADFTCNDWYYSFTDLCASGEITVYSHSAITFRFVSNEQYRDNGWAATINIIDPDDIDENPPAPVIAMRACENVVELIPTMKATADEGTLQLFYTINGSSAIEYSEPFAVSNNDVIVAYAKLGDNQSATNHSVTVNRAAIAPPTIHREDSLNNNLIKITRPTVPSGANDTYKVRYTLDGSDPRTSSTAVTINWIHVTGQTDRNDTIIDISNAVWLSPSGNFQLKAVTQGTTCPDLMSAQKLYTTEILFTNTPVITITGSETMGTIGITCATSGATVYYTIDGSTPDPTNNAAHTYVWGASGAPTTITAGGTVRAYAVAPNHQDSHMASETYVPGGTNGGSNVYGGIVLLDDREDHTLSYYSDGTQPVHSLKPADVKITYTGYGTSTMTSSSTANMPAYTAFDANVAPTQVAVNVGEPGNQFIYLKTLENADPEGEGTSYPYTMIPNPFQVRPRYNASNRGETNTNGINYSQTVSNEVRDRRGNVVAQTNSTSATQNNLGVVSPIVPTRGVNTLLTEGFESSTISTSYSSTGWYTYNASGNNWARSTGYPHNGTYQAQIQFNSSSAANSYLVSAPFTVSANMTQLTVSIWERVRRWQNNTSETFEVFFVKASDVTNAAGVVSATHYNAIASANYTNTSYAEKTGSVTSSALAGQSVRVVVHCTSAADQYYLYIDDITVTETTPNTVKAVAGTNISSAYVAAGQTFPAGTTTTTLNNVASGSYVTFQATPNNGFAFSGWYDQSNNLVSTDNPYTWQVTGDLTLTAKGVPTYTVTAAKETGINTAYVAAGTSFSGTSTTATVAEGGSATFQATVSSGYGFKGWYDEQSNRVSTDLTYTVNNVTGNFTLTAKASTLHNITVASTTNGTVSANPTSAFEGATVTLTVNPSNNYALANIVVTGTSGNTYAVSGVGSTYTFYMPDEDVTVSATFYTPGSDSYRGFYAWRVKSLSDGLTIKSKDGNTTYGVNGIIYADQEVQFITSNAEGNEVEFEALWARAYVTTGSSSMSSYASNGTTGSYVNYKNAYERNFHVVTSSNQTASNYQKDYPATITSRYPDGTSGGGSLTAGNFSASTNTKFENISLGNGTNNSYTANYHDLIFGRGVTGTVYTVRGSDSGTISNAVNMTIRLEQGNFTRLWLTRGRGTNNGQATTFSSTVSVRGVMGCDYDRAKGDNSKLSIAANSYIEGGSGANVFSASANRNNLTYDWNVKSGKIQSTASVNTENPFYLGNYISNSDENGAQYLGKRRLIIEGGEMGTIAGGCDNYGTTGNTTYSTYVVNDGEWTVMIRMKGGIVNGSVYGAAVYTGASGDRRFVFTGGTVKGWIAGGCNGTRTDGGELYGDTYIYVGGTTNCDGSQTTQIGSSTAGHIFGAGSGNSQATGTNATVGRVNNSNVVIADQAQVANNVYGGGNFGYVRVGTGNKSDIYVLGGSVGGSVFGGSNQQQGQIVNMYVKDGTVTGSVYGGSNTSGTVNGAATITMSGGTVSNVYGGGYGSSTNMAAGTNVTVSGGTINSNVYGGGEQGTVGSSSTAANAVVTVSGGEVKGNVYGAGKGTVSETVPFTSANIYGTTTVNITDEARVKGSVYGGGENGSVGYYNNSSTATGSTVNVSGGIVDKDVFGGGSYGVTNGNVVVNITWANDELTKTNIKGSVYGGAYGKRNKVYVKGTKTVNMNNGLVGQSLYGGSRNADDALAWTGTTGETNTSNVVNISGGEVEYQVFAAGFFGHTYGSVYAFIGQNAINTAPEHATTSGFTYAINSLRIRGSVWAGADFGNFDGQQFGDPTVEGKSYVYIDGTNYNTITDNPQNSTYMNIEGSVYGCGTSCDAGKTDTKVVVRNYGQPVRSESRNIDEPYQTATRALNSIQRAKYVILDNAHINYLGQGKVNSLVTTEKYAIHNVSKALRVVNGSSVMINYPIDEIKMLLNGTCANVYAASPTYSPVELSDLSVENKYRVYNGTYINVFYTTETTTTDPNTGQTSTTTEEKYGELSGFAYMMTDAYQGEDDTKSCAYARPKWGQGASFTQGSTDYDNPSDGGFISYTATYNEFTATGATATQNNGVQMRYENHVYTSKNGEDYFRIWRYGGVFSYREAVLIARSSGQDGTYNICDATVELPATEHGGYYRIQVSDNGGGTTINYGTDVNTCNVGYYGSPYSTTTSNWMTYTNDAFVPNQAMTTTPVQSGLHVIDGYPNVNFGLVAIPQGAMTPTSSVTNGNWLICESSDAALAAADTKWTYSNESAMPEVLFRLTYSNEISVNKVLDPVNIYFEQYNAAGELVDVVQVALIITTKTSIEQDVKTRVVAVMNGKGETGDVYSGRVTLPSYSVNMSGEDPSTWTLNSVSWSAALEGAQLVANQQANYQGEDDKFAMMFYASTNKDNTYGWDDWHYGPYDAANVDNGVTIGGTYARKDFTINFDLYYDGKLTSTTQKLGTMTFVFAFNHYGNGDQDRTITIAIDVYRKGTGENYYLDGVNGDNAYPGTRPDAAKKTLAAILSRTEYMAGDNIFIVNTVTQNDAATLSWDGFEYDHITIYRYPGGHPMANEDPDNFPLRYEEYSTANPCFKGVMVDVKKKMEMHYIVIDGFADEIAKVKASSSYVPVGGAIANDFVTAFGATAPMFEVEANGQLTLANNTLLTHNANTSTTNHGGAVKIDENGTLNMTINSKIQGNAAAGKGGGVYMDGTMNISGLVDVTGNTVFTNSKAEAQESNVYLNKYAPGVITMAGDVDEESRIGVTKDEWNNKWYTPVVYSEVASRLDVFYADEDLGRVTDDKEMYELNKLPTLTDFNNPTKYLFFVGTWVTAVTSEPENFAASNIDSPEDLAWAISVATGYNKVNNGAGYPNTNFKLTADIDMDDNIWVPIGNSDVKYTGTFDGNGHVVTGVRSPLDATDKGMFGVIDGATIKNVIAATNFPEGNSQNLAALVAVMENGTISNCEAAGTLVGNSHTENMGGLVAKADAGTIHSVFAVTNMTGGDETIMGGLVGTNKANLYNSYSNVTFAEGSTNTGGLVGINTGTVENCYNASLATYAFAYQNQIKVDEVTTKGTINFSYAAPNVTAYVAADALGTLAGHGNYSAPIDRKALGYLYDDNKITLVSGQTNANVATAVSYAGGKIDKWPGMVSALNTWVGTKEGYAKWSRPTSSTINGDLPVLCFPSDNSLATEDGKFLYYGAADEIDDNGNQTNNGLDKLFTVYAEKDADMFLYGKAVGVTKGNGDNMLYINEDAVLLQAPIASSKADEPQYNDINATTGISFDNSDHGQNAYDYYGNKLTYDWHFMSTPLSDASTGATYESGSFTNSSHANISGMSNGYFPNNLNLTTPAPQGSVMWDFYTYYEPEYHWINLKRGPGNHWHTDGGAEIKYEEADNTASGATFIPGKGYMMAISQDSYMSSTGTLNNGEVEITLTHQESLSNDEIYNRGWNLVGNPYQAYLDLDLVGTGSFYIYDAESGEYVPYTHTASKNPVTPSRYIHPHQGFFMYSATDDNPFTFTPAMATTTNNEGSYFRGDEQVSYPLVNLFAKNQAGNSDLTVIEFNRPEIGGATKVSFMTNANFSIAAHLDNESYGLLFTPEGTEKVPVHFVATEDGTYTLDWSTYNGNFTSLLLVDNMTGVITDMLRSDSYTFEASKDDYASRFYITYTVTDVDEYSEGDGSFAFFDGSDWIVNGKGQLDIVDVTGRVLFSKRIANEQNRVSLGNVAPGVYMMRVTDGKNTMVQKIVVR